MYPTLIPPKIGPSDVGRTGEEVTSKRRRGREEPMEVEGNVGEVISTASVALKAERYRPRIYGFQLNETAKLQRWQEAVRDRYAFCPFTE